MKPLLIIAITVTVVAVLGISYFEDFDADEISAILVPNRIMDVDETFERKPVDSGQNVYQSRPYPTGSETCKNIQRDPLSYPPEVIQRCSSLTQKFSSSPIPSEYVSREMSVLQKLEKTYLFIDMKVEDFYSKATDEMLTPEALERCADLWEDMVQKTTHINKANLETLSPALESQSKFSSSGCHLTRDKWYE
ncbi:MAG: hypothetical protein K5798_03615 [Nitrosopumilus sp.]|uniref:hypothetical protein n=1 Tax=Nitrosopumilus sp. TaxID=2024843 RepID=UPI00242CCE00|nr:hypothetical protein [Nitrosopumilus sp.]MCV0366340.1 hypothetical protein [Nitrosopumilus sp.]